VEGRGRERKMEGGEGTGGEGRPPIIIIISLLRTKAAIQVIKTYKNVKLSKQTTGL